MIDKIWLVLYNTDTRRTWTRYFDTINEKENFKRKIKYIKNLLLIEDSEDIIYN